MQAGDEYLSAFTQTQWVPVGEAITKVAYAPAETAPRPSAAVRNAKRVARDRARKRAAKRHKQLMRRSGK